MFRNTRVFLILSYVIALLSVLASLENPFFWDTVQLGSKHATFFYSSGFSELMLPDEIDSGHIPTFGGYIAFLWTLFGRTLAVSHLAMLPFVIGIVFQLHKLVHRYIPTEFAGLVVFLLLFDPTLQSQMTLISPDVPLVFFFLMGTNAVLSNKRIWIAVAVILLFLTSMRGMMVSLCLLALDLYRNVDYSICRANTLRSWFSKVPTYLPALLIFLAYNYWHYETKGWIGFHEDSPWKASFEATDAKGALRNVGILGWRLLDFGRVIIWAILIFLVVRKGKSLLKKTSTRPWLFLTAVLIVLLPMNMIWAKGLIGHRYLLPVYLAVAILCAAWLFSGVISNLLRNALLGAWFIIMATGNLWVYPEDIAQGWDATLAHRPYFSLREEAKSYITSENIPPSEVGTFFPNASSFDIIDLDGDTRSYVNFSGTEPYVFYSNVYNLNDADLSLLKTRYAEVKRFSDNKIYVAILERSDGL